MNNKYIFDVDGTLTPARQQIDHDFEKWTYEPLEEVYGRFWQREILRKSTDTPPLL